MILRLKLKRSEQGPTEPLLLQPSTKCTQKCQKKHHFWEVSKASPEKCPPLSSLLSIAREVPLSTYPLPVHTKVPKKTPLLRGEESKPWKVPSSLQFPSLHTPYRCTQKCKKKHHFWEVSKASPEKCSPLSRAKREKFPSLHTPYWCTQKCQKTTTFRR